jgi:hypothetical protein
MKVHVKESENGDLTDFERGQIVDASLAGASMTKTETLLGILPFITKLLQGVRGQFA